MTLLKWVLAIAVVLFLAVSAGIIGLYYWASGIESVRVTQADLAIGGSYPPEEREALIAACEYRNVAKKSDTCTCIADRAGTELSRYLRLVLTASLEGSAGKVVAITKGLMEGGVSTDKVEAADKDLPQRIDLIMQACGLNR